MIIELGLHTEPNKGNIVRARDTLLGMDLVYARIDPFDLNSEIDKDVMVWEDPVERIGRYKVHLYENMDGKTGIYDAIKFSYWINERCAKREILEKDPMTLAIRNVLPVLEGKIELKKWNLSVASLQEIIDECFPNKEYAFDK